jgi:hypothetical protein
MAARKRKRRPRCGNPIIAKELTRKRKENRIRVQAKRGNCGPRNRYGLSEHHSDYELQFKARTFEEEYKEYRKSRGRRGFNPDPNSREPDACRIIMGTFPIGELMEKPIRRIKL